MKDLRKDPIIKELATATGGVEKPAEGYVRLSDGHGRTVAWALRRKDYVRLIGLKVKVPGFKMVGNGKTKGIIVTSSNVHQVAAALHKAL